MDTKDKQITDLRARMSEARSLLGAVLFHIQTPQNAEQRLQTIQRLIGKALDQLEEGS